MPYASETTNSISGCQFTLTPSSYRTPRQLGTEICN
jgi:hypothetical protein